jgi:hypothetical protein
MTHLALDGVLQASWINKVFQANRQRQYPRELLSSGVLELILMLLVTPGFTPKQKSALFTNSTSDQR